MKSIDLDAGQRLTVVGILGQQRATLALMSQYLRIIEHVRIKEEDEEALGLKFEDTPQGRVALWNPEVMSCIELEDADARALAGVLGLWDQYDMSQVAQMSKLLERLR